MAKAKIPDALSMKTLPVEYNANKDAWITGDIWKDWLKHLDYTRT